MNVIMGARALVHFLRIIAGMPSGPGVHISLVQNMQLTNHET